MDSFPYLTGEMSVRQSVLQSVLGIIIAVIPYWIAACAGLLIGWSWRPQWAATLVVLAARSRLRVAWTVPPGLGARRLWLALTALSVFSFLKRLLRGLGASSKSVQRGESSAAGEASSHAVVGGGSSHASDENEPTEPTDRDLQTFVSYIEERDGGPPWEWMMEKSTNTLAYQAWRRDPELGPTQYRTKTVFKSASPELVRDFFWDDEFRVTWDDRLIYHNTLKEYPRTGLMIVHWIRKFPLFLRNREYIIIRRIWEFKSSYYCITKGVPYSSMARQHRSQRVDVYYSSWRIRAVETRNEVHARACEVLLIHYEDTGIAKELAKIAVVRGMWDLVKKMDWGMRKYQMKESSGAIPSRYAIMAHMTTKIPSTGRLSLSESQSDNADERPTQQLAETCPRQKFVPGTNMLKWLAIGGVVVLFGIGGGVFGKGITIGVAHRLQTRRKKSASE